MENKQIIQKIKKELNNWDFNKGIKFSGSNESQTRDFLIEPFFKQVLGYSPMDDYLHEYSVKVGESIKKVDMAITLSGGNPDILIECKPTTRDISKDFGQLNEYCLYNKKVKIGILTNGVTYKFYSRSSDDNEILRETPFFEFNLLSYNDSDLETLANFFRKNIDLSHIINKADEIYFLESFNNALFSVLSQPNEDLIKLIYHQMGGKKTTAKISDKLFKLINSISIELSLDRIKSKETKDVRKGIVTTSEEIKTYNIIKTILGLSNAFKLDLDRVTYRDYKDSFKVILDDNQQKSICSIEMNSNNIILTIEGEPYEIQSVSVSEITKYKKKIVDAAIKADS
tara:strand:+ start:226 stop:1251 length:1026 start_codon:yes stop_codon:yes gene_type:complete